MQIEHYEKRYKYNDKDLLYVARRVGKLATLCKRVKDEGSYIRVEVEQRKTKKAQDSLKMMINIHLPKKLLRAESRRDLVTEACDRCMDKLLPQIEKYKDLHTNKGLAQKKGRKTAVRAKQKLRKGR